MDLYIVTLADAYANNWLHRVPHDIYVREFIEIEAETSPEECSVDGAMGFTADLSLGWYDETIEEDDDPEIPNRLSGFTARLWEIDGMGEDRGWSESIWSRAYPMDNIPIPAYMREPSPENAPQGRA
jgi:hypothetical protein